MKLRPVEYGLVIAFFGALLGLIFLVDAYTPRKQPQQANAPVAEPSPTSLTKVTRDGYIGAVSESALDEAITYVTRKDEAAFNQMVQSGEVFYLKAGIPVVIDKCMGLICSKVRVQAVGTRATFYTVGEAIASQP